MPYLDVNGIATAHLTSDTSQSRYISWTDLAKQAGVPSHADEAEYGAKAFFRQQAQQTILDAFNAKAAA